MIHLLDRYRPLMVTNPSQPPDHPRQFGWPVTALCGLAAIGGLGLGGYATIESGNELGTVASYAVGFLFSVIAIIGRVPRLKFGDTEVDPGPVVAAAHAGADEVADKVAEAAIAGKDSAEIAEVARATSDNVTRAFLSLMPESAKIGSDVFLQRLLHRQAGRGRDWDLWLAEKAAGDTDGPDPSDLTGDFDEPPGDDDDR